MTPATRTALRALLLLVALLTSSSVASALPRPEHRVLPPEPANAGDLGGVDAKHPADGDATNSTPAARHPQDASRRWGASNRLNPTVPTEISKISASSDGDYLFEYDAVGRNTKLTYPGGLERTEAYDHEGRITSRCYSHPNATQRCYGATYDATGNPTSLTDPEGQDAITYDALDRLSTVTRGSETQTYDYNALGALKTNDTTVLDDQRPKLGGGGNASAAVPATYNNLPVTLDAGGRVTSLQGETLLYSLRGALAGITKVNGGTTDAEYYGHDSFGRRIATAKASTTGGVTTWAPQEMYEWTGANVTGQLDVVKLGNTSTPTVTVSKTWLFEGVDRPLRLKVGGLKYFYELDLAGNVRRLRRPDGSDAGGYRYSAFGTQYAGPAPAVDQPLRWKGRWWSDFGGIYDVRARQWSPALGAFTSVDEFVFHDARSTLWGWPNQNPTRFADVSGRCGPWCVAAAAAGLYLIAGALLSSDQPHDLTQAEVNTAVAGALLPLATVAATELLGAAFPRIAAMLSGGGGAAIANKVGSGGAGEGEACEEAEVIAQRLLTANGGSVTKSLADVARMQLGQAKTLDVLKQMYDSTGRQTGGVQTLADGSVALLSRRVGADQAILLISDTGAVRTATATLELTGDPANPLRAVNIQ